MIAEALSAPGARIGFTSRPTIDTSPERGERVRLAVARAKEGDREALAYLYASYSDNVYGYVRMIVRDDHEAEDVVQHVFTKLITIVGRYDDRRVPFAAWLLRIARNVAIDHLRANRLRTGDEMFDPQAICDPDLEHAAVVRAALKAIPLEQRQVVVLRHLVGLTPREIADRLGRTESSVHGLHHRGRQALKRELTRLESEPHTHPPRSGAVA